MAHFELYLLEYFIAVVETGSFTRAADRVFVTQPTLSSGIKKLEGQVGHTLFERTNRRVFLTDAGSKFLPRAKAILHECNMAVQALGDADAAPVLRVGFLTTLSNRAVAHLLANFKATYPDVTFEVQDGTEQTLRNRLDDRSLDYVLSVSRGEVPEKAIALYEEPYVFILARGHALLEHGRLRASDLAQERMVVRSRCEILSETSRYFTDRNVRPRLVYRTDNDSRAVSMVAAGLGGTVVPNTLVDERVVPISLEGFTYKRRLALIRPQYTLSDAATKVAQEFEAYVRSAWQDKPVFA